MGGATQKERAHRLFPNEMCQKTLDCWSYQNGAEFIGLTTTPMKPGTGQCESVLVLNDWQITGDAVPPKVGVSFFFQNTLSRETKNTTILVSVYSSTHMDLRVLRE